MGGTRGASCWGIAALGRFSAREIMDGFWGCLRAAGLVAAEEHRRGDMEPKPEKDEDHYTVSGRAMVRPETTNSPEQAPLENVHPEEPQVCYPEPQATESSVSGYPPPVGTVHSSVAGLSGSAAENVTAASTEGELSVESGATCEEGERTEAGASAQEGSGLEGQ